jgi:hypothetical protein
VTYYDRRAFLGLTAGALSVLHNPQTVFGATCVTSGLPEFLPARLTVDCASRKNYNIFRANSGYMGLAGAVNMTWVQGKYGRYEAGNLFLFPWLKDKGRAFGPNKVWGSLIPISATQTMAMSPINQWLLPPDEHFCRYCIQAPWASFIGFRLDVAVGVNDAKRPWFTNTKLADGRTWGIAWNSSNLNDPWFGGSRWIPNTDGCKGNAWRALIVDGLKQASAGVCA